MFYTHFFVLPSSADRDAGGELLEVGLPLGRSKFPITDDLSSTVSVRTRQSSRRAITRAAAGARRAISLDRAPGKRSTTYPSSMVDGSGAPRRHEEAEQVDRSWPVGEERQFAGDELIDLPSGATFALSGVLTIGDQPGVIEPIITVDGRAMVGEALYEDDADELADWVTHRHDLDAVVNRAKRAHAAAIAADTEECLAYWEAAIVAYGRCFGTGASAIKRQRRSSIPLELVDSLGLRDAHDEMYAHRNRGVGHRGPHEWLRAKVGLFRDPESGDAVALLPMALFQLPDADTIARLHELASTLLSAVETRIRSHGEEISRAHGIASPSGSDGA